MAKRIVIATSKAPAAIGPYSQAIVYGDLVYCSGQIALDPESGELVGNGDVRAQTRQALDNLDAVLQAASTSLRAALKVTIYLADMGDFTLVNEIYAERVGEEPPARATVEVSRLPKDTLVEIDAVAVVGG